VIVRSYVLHTADFTAELQVWNDGTYVLDHEPHNDTFSVAYAELLSRKEALQWLRKHRRTVTRTKVWKKTTAMPS
jgi:hypothetical protein